jgi:DinB superfamily
MKRMEWIGLAAALVLFAGAVSGQQSSAPVANPVASTVKSQLPRFAKNMVAAAEAMPAEKYSFKPTPEMNTYGHLVLHSLQANNNLCSKISGSTAPEVTLTDTDPKDKLVAALKASFDFCTTALANADDSKLGDPMTSGPNRQSTRAGVMILLSDEWFDHYGTQAVYLRLNGILPPSAQPTPPSPPAKP